MIVVDDGLATGATAKAAIKALRGQNAARIILAVPVAPLDAAAELRGEVDELVCLHELQDFQGVGAAYADFHQLTDAEVLALLASADGLGKPA
ncbi:MAG: phosphoribosyltransferase family protein [Caulobacter sp.]|nr:phosphoribosyltransferase family protein [Caulobacter sp.]